MQTNCRPRPPVTITFKREQCVSFRFYCVCTKLFTEISVSFHMYPSASLCFVQERLCLQGSSEAHENEHMYGEQVSQKEISRASATRQQPGEVKAPASEPPSTRHHPSFHLRGETEAIKEMLTFALEKLQTRL